MMELLLCMTVILQQKKQHELMKNGKQQEWQAKGMGMFGKLLCIYVLLEKILMFLCLIATMGLVLSQRESLKITSAFRYSKLMLSPMKILIPTGHNGLI